MNHRTLLKLQALLVMCLLAGCASFDREWQAASHSRDPFAGRWEGRWTSTKHRGAGGSLRCVLTPHDARHYRGAFRAGWLGIHSSYTALLQAERRGRELRLRGGKDLGFLFGGIYRYEGRVTPARFVATYDSSYDTGRFEMARPAQESSRQKQRRD